MCTTGGVDLSARLSNGSLWQSGSGLAIGVLISGVLVCLGRLFVKVNLQDQSIAYGAKWGPLSYSRKKPVRDVQCVRIRNVEDDESVFVNLTVVLPVREITLKTYRSYVEARRVGGAISGKVGIPLEDLASLQFKRDADERKEVDAHKTRKSVLVSRPGLTYGLATRGLLSVAFGSFFGVLGIGILGDYSSSFTLEEQLAYLGISFVFLLFFFFLALKPVVDVIMETTRETRIYCVDGRVYFEQSALLAPSKAESVGIDEFCKASLLIIPVERWSTGGWTYVICGDSFCWDLGGLLSDGSLHQVEGMIGTVCQMEPLRSTNEDVGEPSGQKK